MRPIAPILILAGLLGTATAGDIYCLNKGKDCSDRPAPGAEFIRTEVHRPDASPPQPAPATKVAAGNAAPAQAPAGNTVEAYRKDMNQARAEHCKNAQDAYQKALKSRRIYRTNAAGEREYLSDTEADQLRLNARVEMEQSCGSTAP
jgi:hypothetical protein